MALRMRHVTADRARSAALAIMREAYAGFLNPRTIDAPALGLTINAAAGAINGVWCWILIRQGRALRSPALTADGRHLLSDVVTSAGVVLGLLLVPLTGFTWLDPVLAVAVALNIIWSGWGLVKESVGGLMDEALPESVLARVREVIALNAEGAIEAHDLT